MSRQEYLCFLFPYMGFDEDWDAYLVYEVVDFLFPYMGLWWTSIQGLATTGNTQTFYSLIWDCYRYICHNFYPILFITFYSLIWDYQQVSQVRLTWDGCPFYSLIWDSLEPYALCRILGGGSFYSLIWDFNYALHVPLPLLLIPFLFPYMGFRTIQ